MRIMRDVGFRLKYSVLKRVWWAAFVVGLIGNAYLIYYQIATTESLSKKEDKSSIILQELPKRLQKKGVLPSQQDKKTAPAKDLVRTRLGTNATNEDTSVFSICLLIKDDNELLNEWIAYHYHTLRLRHLVVAVDPSSQTSPSKILQTWRQSFGLVVEEWTDRDYMPDFFLQGMYEQVPRMIKWSDNATKWKGADNVSEEELERTFQRINLHRYRQAMFLRACTKHLKKQGRTWMTHVDTDEFLVINPMLRREGIAGNVSLPKELGKDTILGFLNDLTQLNAKVVNWPCISMPRVMFGSHEDNNDRIPAPPEFQTNKLETYRWKYHADFRNFALNKLPKVIMDVSGFQDSPLNSSRVFSIHRPSILLCRKQGQMDFWDGRKYPLTVNHYVGSLERYQAREDPRRTSSAYLKKSQVTDGKDDNWMNGWLPSFVATYGIEKVREVLGDYMSEHEILGNRKPLKLGISIPMEKDSFSACLLVKDDNSILSEWIAYHYHALKLRTLIVAVDSSSKTSPSAILSKFRKLGMSIDEWSDLNYMPDYFVKGDYSKVPNMLGNATDGSWHIENNGQDVTVSREEFERVNNHRFRQVMFLGSCVKELRDRGKTWMIHIDTDEYVVLHPDIRHLDSWRQLPISTHVTQDSLFSLLKRAATSYTKAMKYPCLSMPRLLFGSVEDRDPPRNPVGFNGTKLETFRWKYHAGYNSTMNGKQKTILDLSGIPPKATFLQEEVYSIHRPGLHLCRGPVSFDLKYKFPLTINHYLGSWERYSSRQDSRRSQELYDAKANLKGGKDDHWIESWVDSFVKVHGMKTASDLLGEYIVGHNNDELSAATGSISTIAEGGPRPIPPSVLSFDEFERGSFSACMLIKDDNDILNEWFAYHYHTIALRHVIVALDATSTTSPDVIFDKWRKFGMTIEVWNDEMFMPDIFFEKAYHKMPRLAKIKRNKHKWVEEVNNTELATEYLHKINDHRFRQITFVSACAKSLRKQNRTWMVHIDTDEYIVVNPTIRVRKTLGEKIRVPSDAGSSAVLRMLNQMVKPYWETMNYPCISMPRLMFGSIEDTNDAASVPIQFNATKFETLRWKYHAAFDDAAVNKQPKVIMDVSAIPEDDKMFTEGRVFSIHRPSQFLCRNQGQMDFQSVEFYPFTVNHYLGTYERFNARDDPRRNQKLYDIKAQVKEGKDDNWINTWLPSFIDEHGIEVVSNLLEDYTLTA